jgi:sulfoxide reductase heme-binding subunit YedZ
VVRKADFGVIWDEGVQPDLATGWLALFVFAALALTSNDASLRLLRRAWKNLHRFVYAGAVLTFAHWIWIAFDIVPALIYGGILVLLEACRLLLPLARRSRSATSA